MPKINSKIKGSNNERECVKILNERFGEGFKRTPYSGSIFGQSNKHFGDGMSDEQKSTLSGDIITPSDFKFNIEHKAYADKATIWDFFNEKSNLNSWFKQCQDDANFANKEPLLIIKYNNKKRICFIHIKLDNYIFEYKGWYCYWFEDLLKQTDIFFKA
jgi:hypothetical protein